MGMGSNGIRILVASICLIAFMLGYNLILIDIMNTRIPDCEEMKIYAIKTLSVKMMGCLAYFVSNSLMCLTYKSQFEKEVLITGILSLATIGLINFMHYFGIFIMSTQAALITFNSITILFFILIYTFGKLNDLFYDRE
jgi:hypothetical protein